MIAANGADANPTGSLSVLPNSIAAGVVSSCDVTNPSLSGSAIRLGSTSHQPDRSRPRSAERGSTSFGWTQPYRKVNSPPVVIAAMIALKSSRFDPY